MTYCKRILLMAAILLSCVGCDQVTKEAARIYLAPAPALSFWGDLFRLEYAENPGAFLSLGARLSDDARLWLFTGLNGLGLAALLLFLLLRQRLSTGYLVGLSLLLAGGIGNLIDRIVNDGVVTDFLNIGIGGLRSGIFNVADVAVMAGEGLLLFLLARRDQSPPAQTLPSKGLD